MTPSPKILWGEGLFLRPQHFQQQDRYHEWRLAQMAQALHPQAWGLQGMQVDADALGSGVLRLTSLALISPDGEVVRAPDIDELPPPLQLHTLPDTPGGGEWVFHLAMAPLREAGGNAAASPQEADTALRYYHRHSEVPDIYTQAVPAEVVTLGRSLRVLGPDEPRAHLITLPLLALRRTATGGFERVERFMPPSLSLQACPPLLMLLRRLMDVLQAKVDALYGMHREPSKNIIEFRSGDVASFWLLHTASAGFARLTHLLRQPGYHPERLFESLLELAGALMTFSRGFTLADLPTYDHLHPGPAFAQLDHIIRELLDTVISTRYFAIHLQEQVPSFHQGRLDSEQVHAQTQLYLGVSAAMAPMELVETVPMRFKVGAPDDVDKLVLSAMPGVRLVHAPQVPAAVPVRPGAYYFTLEARGPLYERMLQAQSVTVYVPAGVQDLKLELIAVNA
ncbi:type VI secretion system baseplate subunit TssK [Aquabacterium lacunae]|uniref:Type VI secretion system baseplate subunit TssK n=1 Tax=Aquabacterium lacunae TaxID=2528630 RepID=A0A4Q9H2E2_9BURK|nr:type VI secretion system baseplate subunit TssK [Aquabacterium lacunae]TBO34252.1 type VI secretion system baseplate subunit TssK [Aquabacterium lacunae]